MKNVCFIVNTTYGGGAEIVSLKLAKLITKNIDEISIDIITLKNTENAKIDSNRYNLKEINFNLSRSIFIPFKLPFFLKRKKYDYIVVFKYEMILPVLISILFLREKPKLLFRNINTISAKFKKSKGEVYFIKRLYWRLTFLFLNQYYYRIIHQCECMKGDFLNYFNLNQAVYHQKNIVIYNPAQTVSPEVIKNDIGEGYFLYVGRLSKVKRVAHLLSAFAIYRANGGEKKLIICGEGEDFHNLCNKAQRLKIMDSVKFLGYVENLNFMYERAVATLLTSTYEGFPNVLIESLSHGTPVISYNVDCGPSEIIINNKNGYLISDGDIEEFANKMITFDNENNFKLDDIKDSTKQFDPHDIIEKWSNVLQ